MVLLCIGVDCYDLSNLSVRYLNITEMKLTYAGHNLITSNKLKSWVNSFVKFSLRLYLFTSKTKIYSRLQLLNKHILRIRLVYFDLYFMNIGRNIYTFTRIMLVLRPIQNSGWNKGNNGSRCFIQWMEWQAPMFIWSVLNGSLNV